MFKFIIFIILVLFIIGSGNVFDFNSDSATDVWIITIHHQELLGSIANGFNIIYDFIDGLMQPATATTK